MKYLLMTFLLVLTLVPKAQAFDQASIDALTKQGFVVRMGELTGAGSRMSLGQLQGFIHPRGIVMKADCKSISVGQATNQANPLISDVTKVFVDQSVINASEFEGFFTK